MARRRYNHGFTLIELSIVMTIIGLIVGGILIGSELILSARIQRTVSQMEKLVTATYTFKAKYNWIPGDMTAPVAQENGLTGAPCYVSGNSGAMIGNYPPLLPPMSDGCEPDWWYLTTGNTRIDEGTRESSGFYTHLSLAGLIEGYYGQSLWSVSNEPSKLWMEPALKRGMIYPTDCDGRYCFLLGASFYPTVTTFAQPIFDLFSPYESFSIDRKIDDGKPATGQVTALTSFSIILRNSSGEAPDPPIPLNPPPSTQCCQSEDGSNTNNQCAVPTSSYRVANNNYLCMIAARW